MKFKKLFQNHPYTIIFVGEYNNLTEDYLTLFKKYTPLNVYIFEYELLYKESEK